MGGGLLNLGMLFGLAGLAIPLFIHLLRRRHYDVVAWGAMQFLPAAITTRRRRFWDELPLMAVRLGTIALLVVALAGPYSASAVFAPLAEARPRDTVIVLDGSYSMGRQNEVGPTPWEEACRRAVEQVSQLGRGERVALIVARRPPLAWQPDLTADRSQLIERLTALPAPRGNAGLPQAIAAAYRLLQSQGEAVEQEVLVLTDRQFHGWADDTTRQQWQALGRQLRADLGGPTPRVPHLRVVAGAGDRPASLPNVALGPLTASRGIVPVGHGVQFTTTLLRSGTIPVRNIRVLVDGVLTQQLPLPSSVEASPPQLPLTFTQHFDRPGRRVVTAAVDLGDRLDALGVDNEQHAVVEVAADLPVLLVDGDARLGPESSSFFLDKALAGPGQHSIVRPRVVSHRELTAGHLLGNAASAAPRVVVLADVPALSTAARKALEQFVMAGGGLLVALGPRVEPSLERYNAELYRDGQGVLPARLLAVAQGTVRPAPGSVQQAALERLRPGLGELVFKRWWKLADGPVAARLDNGDALWFTRAFGQGRVVLFAVPLDRCWDSSLPGSWEYPVLVHELIYDLAGARTAGWRLDDGRPLQLGPGRNGTAPGRLVVQTPDGASRTVEVHDWPWTDADAGAVGLYRVERNAGEREYFVVPPDLAESDERRCTDAEWQDVLRRLPTAGDSATTEPTRPHQLWWLLLLGVMSLLCGEVLLTRRLARRRAVR